MRLALAPKVAVVEEDTAVAEEDEGVADEDQRVAVASNHRHSTYITSYLSAFSDFVQPCQILPIMGLSSAYGDGAGDEVKS